MIAIATAGALSQAHAQPAQQPASPPLPPPRPSSLDERPGPSQEPPRALSSPVRDAPQEAARETPQPPQPQPPPVETHRPFDREASRACAEEWARMKRSGAARNVVWRDFAAECLPRYGERQR